MDQDRRFRTIEVIDSRTDQECKVACMSCIRGHRTTSCGNLVCRNKIFWTVKRPGRPSNTCTCRYGPSGRCRCAVARSACPHKAKKGEKRTVDCRCEEHGRYCCLLEPRHWDALIAQLRPKVDFYPNREALEVAGHGAPQTMGFPPTPTYTGTTPGSPHGGAQFLDLMPTPSTSLHSTPAPLPRFGLMGVGLPQGSSHDTPDVLKWQGQAPQAPRDYHASGGPNQQRSTNVAATQTATQAGSSLSPDLSFLSSTINQQYPNLDLDFDPVAQSFGDMSMLPQDRQASSTFEFEKMMADYSNYQLPSAICQNCGMSGCTCKNCPAVMQNFANGSWAQCCARKHTHMGPPPPHPAVDQVLGPNPPQQAPGGCCSGSASSEPGHQIVNSPNSDITVADLGLEYGIIDFNCSGCGCCSGSAPPPPQEQQQYHPPPASNASFNHDCGPMHIQPEGASPNYSQCSSIIGDFPLSDGTDLSDLLMNDLGGHCGCGCGDGCSCGCGDG